MTTQTPTGRRTRTGGPVLGLALPLLAASRPGNLATSARLDPSSPPPLSAHRARNRVAAFVYGNVTLLAAVIASTSAMAADGAAFALVLAAASTTFVAHALSELFAHQIAPSGQTGADYDGLRAELRDAVPIATAAAVPLLAFGLGWLGLLDASAARMTATAVIIARLAGTGLVVERLQGRRTRAATLWAGLALAAAGSVVAIVKVLVTH